MRLKEWYSWHFPELADILTDNFVYAKMVALIGMKENVKDTQESQAKEIVPLEIWQEIKDAVHISMGSEILEKDEVNVKGLANQIVEISQYREALSEYIKNRMMAIAPNLTNMVGEVVGARLVAKAGSLMNLAK
jgi:nucleolar protein 58